MGTTEHPSPRWKRLGWFFGIWLASVAAIAAMSLILRAWLL